MRALIITPTLETNSGWGRYSLNVIEEYRKRGVSFTVCSLDARANDEVETYQILPLTPLNFFINIIRIRKISSAFDVTHAFDAWPYALYGFFAVLGTNKKLFINAVGTYSFPGGTLVKKILIGLAYNRCHKIFCISHYIKRRIDEYYPGNGKSLVVSLGVTMLPSVSQAEKDEWTSEYKIDGHSPIFITVGAIKKRKGQLDTARALALLKDEYPNLLYLLVGDDGDLNYVQQIVSVAERNGMENNIKVVSGSIDDKKLSFFYQKSDLAILNSLNYSGHFEGFGLMFIEAGQFGVPGVGSAGCGIEDAVDDGLTGYLSKQGDPSDIAQKIKMALSNKDILGPNAALFSKKFPWSQTAETYLSFYKSEN